MLWPGEHLWTNQLWAGTEKRGFERCKQTAAEPYGSVAAGSSVNIHFSPPRLHPNVLPGAGSYFSASLPCSSSSHKPFVLSCPRALAGCPATWAWTLTSVLPKAPSLAQLSEMNTTHPWSPNTHAALPGKTSRTIPWPVHPAGTPLRDHTGLQGAYPAFVVTRCLYGCTLIGSDCLCTYVFCNKTCKADRWAQRTEFSALKNQVINYACDS